MARPSIDEVRQRLLEAGVTVFRRDLRPNEQRRSLAALDLKEVAAEAGYSSPGMIYTAWTDKDSEVSPREAYSRDLLKRLVDESTEGDGLDDDLEAALEAGLPTVELVKLVANESYDRQLRADGWALFQALALMPKGNEFERLLADSEDEVTRHVGELFEFGMKQLDRKCRPGITGFDIAQIGRALELGMSTMASLDQGKAKKFDLEWRDSEDWSLYAIAMVELLLALSEPIT